MKKLLPQVLTRLQARITIPIIILMLVVQGIGYFVIHAAITTNSQADVEESLGVTERVFQQVLGANRDQLAQAATITAADFGFRSAVALKNRETISSALGNQADRIHATIKGPASEVAVDIFFAKDEGRTPVLARIPLPLGTFTVELAH